MIESRAEGWWETCSAASLPDHLPRLCRWLQNGKLSGESVDRLLANATTRLVFCKTSRTPCLSSRVACIRHGGLSGLKPSCLRIGERAGRKQDDWSQPGLTGEDAVSVPESRINWHGLQCGGRIYAGVTSAYDSLFSANCTVLHHFYRPIILEGGR